MKKIKVMIIDDSAFVRLTLTRILNNDPEIQVIATAADPIFAAAKIPKEKPDVITLDLEMPRMNGLTFLKKLMSDFPVPVVIISSLTMEGSEMSFKALDYGAIEVITKPKLINKDFNDSQILICDAVKAAAQAHHKRGHTRLSKISDKADLTGIVEKFTADEILGVSKSTVAIKNTTDKIIIIGASTGGTQAIETLLRTVTPDCPGIVIVQHMPEIFTKSFAERLNSVCKISVTEGVPGEIVTAGKAIIAPGNKHTLIKRTGARYSIEVIDGPLVNRHRPSVDVLFRSAANCAGANAVGIILTGMGNDGARGLLEMKNAGAYTIAQDEESCVIFGMPKMAIKMEAASIILPLHEISEFACLRLKNSHTIQN